MPDTNPAAAIPSWDEGINQLGGKLIDLVAEGHITINDARVIQHLVSAYRAEQPARDPASTTSSVTETRYMREQPSTWSQPFGFALDPQCRAAGRRAEGSASA